MALFAKKSTKVDPLVKAQALGENVRDFFSTLLGDLEEANSHASTAVQESDSVIAEHTARKQAALAEIDANAQLTNGLRSLVG